MLSQILRFKAVGKECFIPEKLFEQSDSFSFRRAIGYQGEEYKMAENKYEQIIDNIINSNDSSAKVGLARNCNGDEDILNKLLATSSEDCRVMSAIAEGCEGNPVILLQLCESDDYRTRAAAARFSKGNIDVLNALADDEHGLVKEWVAKTCEGNTDIFGKLADENEPWPVRESVAQSCKGDEALLERLYKEANDENDPKGFVRKAVKKEMRAYKIKEPKSSDMEMG